MDSGNAKTRLTPLKAIRRECLVCSGDSFDMVRNCPSTNCALWPYRFGRNPEPEEIGGRPSPLRAIRAKCKECVGFEVAEIARCTEQDLCSLWEYRYGKNPRRKGASGRGDPEVLKSWRKRRSHSGVSPPERTEAPVKVGQDSGQEPFTPPIESEPTPNAAVMVEADMESETSPESQEKTPARAG